MVEQAALSEKRVVRQELYAWFAMAISGALQVLSVISIAYSADNVFTTVLLSGGGTVAAFIATVLRFMLTDGKRNKKRFILTLTCFILSLTITLMFIILMISI